MVGSIYHCDKIILQIGLKPSIRPRIRFTVTVSITSNSLLTEPRRRQCYGCIWEREIADKADDRWTSGGMWSLYV